MDRRDFTAATLGIGAMSSLVSAANAQTAGAAALETIRARTLGGAITDVPGVKVGHFTDERRPTGCTQLQSGGRSG